MQQSVDRYSRLLRDGAFLLLGGWGIVISAISLFVAMYKHLQGSPWHLQPFYQSIGATPAEVGQLMPIFGQPAILLYSVIGALMMWQGWKILESAAPEDASD